MNKIKEGYKMTELGEIPIEWKVKSLDDICDFKGRIGWRGYTKDDLREIGPLVIGATQISNSNRLDFSNPTYLSEEKYEESPEIKVYLNDIILVKTGNTIGKVAIVDKEIGNATINPNTVLLKNIECFNRYLYYIIVSEIIQKPLKKSITVGAQPSVNQETLKKILIPIPTEKEQKKIALILSTVDEQIDNVDSLIEKNKELKKGLMQTLLTKGIGHTKFKKTEIGEIPEAWEVKKLGDIFKLSSGNFLSQKNIVEGCYPVYGGNGVNGYHNEYMFQESKLVIGRVGAKCGCVCLSQSKAWITDNALYISEKVKEFDDKYMYYLLDSINLNSYANQNAQPVISGQKIYGIYVAYPNINEQIKIAKILLEIDEKIKEHKNKKQKLEELKKGLMQQLLTGNIRIN